VPKVFDWKGYRFHFYAEEGDPREPVHIHVRQDLDNAKFWLHPRVTLAYNRGFPPHVLTQLVAVIEQRSKLIESVWNDFFD
jgi:Domain of unknown function (DUF4160)